METWLLCLSHSRKSAGETNNIKDGAVPVIIALKQLVLFDTAVCHKSKCSETRPSNFRLTPQFLPRSRAPRSDVSVFPVWEPRA